MLEFLAEIKKFFRTDQTGLELRQSRAFLDSLIENLPDMVFVKDARDLRFVRFNKAGENLLGFSRKDLLGKNDFDFFPPEQAQAFIDKDRTVLSGKTIVDIPQEPINTKHKGTRILHTKKIPLFGPDGTPTHLLGISEDITERIQADEERLRISREEAALHEREQINRRNAVLAEASTALATSLDYRKTLKKIAELMVPTFADWCTVTIQNEDSGFERVAAVHRDANKAALIDELLSNYPPHDNGDMSTGYVVHSGKSVLTKTVPDELLRRAAMDERHYQIMKDLGTYSCMLIPIPGRNKVLGTLAFTNGESKRIYTPEDVIIAEELGKRAGIAIDNSMLYEAAQKSSEMRDEFLSIASHELKTPLTSLLLQLQMAKRAALSDKKSLTEEKVAKIFDVSLKQVQRLSLLIEDLLDVSKISAGKLELKLENTNLTELAKEMITQFRQQLDQVKCEIKIEIQSNITGYWDQNRLAQVFANLLSNCIKYAPGKPVHIQICLENTVARIEVKDFGPGIAKDKQNKIFQRFERANHSRNIEGLGLGLFIVKQIIQSHRGTIAMESEINQGTTFTIRLPIR